MDRLKELELENQELRKQVAFLTEKVELLLKKVEELSHPKTSVNSSMSPSHDLRRKSVKSLRQSSGRKSGGQEGHKGSTLKKSSTPDTTIPLFPSYTCSHCGTSLANAEMTLSSTRQVVDIPPLTPQYTEYAQYSCTCPHCQNQEKSRYPKGVEAPIQYGKSVQSLISYLSVYQYLPYARMRELFQDIFSLPLSEGTIYNSIEKSALNLKFVYDEIHSQLSTAEVVGSDETGIKVDGKKEWLWTWQNSKNTYLTPSSSRGYMVIEEKWKKGGFPLATVVTDRWKAQLKTPAKQHQICLAHLLRDCTYITEVEDDLFSADFKTLLYDVFTFKKDQKEGNEKETDKLEQRLNTLLARTIDKEKYPLSYTLQNQMISLRQMIFPCLYQVNIPPDNNGSERAVRNAKVKMKVSGMFKTGQNAFCIIRSVVDTMKKRGQKVLPTITHMLTLNYQELEVT